MLCGTRRLEFGLPSELESPSTRPQGHALPHRGSSIDQGLCADATGAPAILLEDSRPQAILKLRPRNSLDYSTRYECQLAFSSFINLIHFNLILQLLFKLNLSFCTYIVNSGRGLKL